MKQTANVGNARNMAFPVSRNPLIRAPSRGLVVPAKGSSSSPPADPKLSVAPFQKSPALNPFVLGMVCAEQRFLVSANPITQSVQRCRLCLDFDVPIAQHGIGLPMALVPNGVATRKLHRKSVASWNAYIVAKKESAPLDRLTASPAMSGRPRKWPCWQPIYPRADSSIRRLACRPPQWPASTLPRLSFSMSHPKSSLFRRIPTASFLY